MTEDLLRCSFCAKSQKSVAKLIAGPGVFICDADLTRAEQGARPAMPHEKCSFCGKSEVAAMYTPSSEWTFSPPDLAICNECIKLCREIIDEDTEIAEAMEVELGASTVTASVAPEQRLLRAIFGEKVIGARCPSCRAVLAESARTQLLDVKPDGDHEGARVMFLYCSSCGTTIDDIMLPTE